MKLIYNGTQVDDTNTVIVNLSGNDPKKGRISVNESFTLGQLGVKPVAQKVQKPAFPDVAIANVTKSAKTAGDKQAEINRLIREYTKAAEAFQEVGAPCLEDQIVDSVLKYLVEAKGFSTKDDPNAPTISRKELSVTAVPLHDGKILFTVCGTAVWG